MFDITIYFYIYIYITMSEPRTITMMFALQSRQNSRAKYFFNFFYNFILQTEHIFSVSGLLKVLWNFKDF